VIALPPGRLDPLVEDARLVRPLGPGVGGMDSIRVACADQAPATNCDPGGFRSGNLSSHAEAVTGQHGVLSAAGGGGGLASFASDLVVRFTGVSGHEQANVEGALVGGLAASVVLISTSAVAGTGVGGVFNLGKTNTVNAQSKLTGSTSAKNLQLTNTGSGQGLGITVGAGKAPIVVNSGAGKATNLNADKLDGLNSTDYYKKTDTVAEATHASNADNLGGQPASAYQRPCQNGAIMGRAEIGGASASTSNWTTTGVTSNTKFVCDPAIHGANVLVERTATGTFEVVFGDTVIGNTLGLGTGDGPLAQVTSKVAGETVAASGPFQCAPGSPPPVFVTCFIVTMRDSANAAVNGNFTITIG
jgi:hypothetical protein